MHAVPKMGPPGGPIFGTVFRFIFVKFFASGLKKRNVLVSTEALWLMASGKATWVTREALSSEVSGRSQKASFEKVSGPRIGSVGASCFVDDFVPCWGKQGAYPLLLEPGGS